MMRLKETPYQNSGAKFLKARDKGFPWPMVNVIGVPFDNATSFRSGARGGPNAIREASLFLTDGAHPFFKIDPANHVVDHGDVVTGMNWSATQDSMYSAYNALYRNRANPFPTFTMGGDHLVTLGVLRALDAYHPAYDRERLKLIIFDAHCDTWADNFGLPYGHGTWVRNAVEEGYVSAKNIVQIGIRSPVDPETGAWLTSRGGRVHGPDKAMTFGLEDLQYFTSGSDPVYISLDIDVLDPAFAPGTGTPEVGGLTTRELRKFFENPFVRLDHLIGADVVEVSPAYDHANITALAGATMLWSMISGYIAGYIAHRGSKE